MRATLDIQARISIVADVVVGLDGAKRFPTVLGTAGQIIFRFGGHHFIIESHFPVCGRSGGYVCPGSVPNGRLQEMDAEKKGLPDELGRIYEELTRVGDRGERGEVE